MKRKESIGRRQIIETGVLFAFLAVLAGIFLNVRDFYFAASAILAIVLVFPIILKPLAVAWFGLSRGLGWAMSRILLTVIFYMLVVPVGLIRKAMGADILRTRIFKKTSQSNWITRNHRFKSDDLVRPF